MSEPHQQLAQKVVRSFKASLSEEALAGISEAQFEDLAIMIQEAVAEALGDAAELVSAVVRQLREECARLKPDMEM